MQQILLLNPPNLEEVQIDASYALGLSCLRDFLDNKGYKVAIEISLMAADAGTLTGNDILAVGGTESGADSAIVLKPSHSPALFDLRTREIVCKPRDF